MDSLFHEILNKTKELATMKKALMFTLIELLVVIAIIAICRNALPPCRRHVTRHGLQDVSNLKQPDCFHHVLTDYEGFYARLNQTKRGNLIWNNLVLDLTHQYYGDAKNKQCPSGHNKDGRHVCQAWADYGPRLALWH